MYHVDEGKVRQIINDQTTRFLLLMISLDLARKIALNGLRIFENNRYD